MATAKKSITDKKENILSVITIGSWIGIPLITICVAHYMFNAGEETVAISAFISYIFALIIVTGITNMISTGDFMAEARAR